MCYTSVTPPQHTHTHTFPHRAEMEGERSAVAFHCSVKKPEEVTPKEEAVLLRGHSGVVMKDRFAVVYATIVLSIFPV